MKTPAAGSPDVKGLLCELHSVKNKIKNEREQLNKLSWLVPFRMTLKAW
jgi:hypothetical protein